MLLPCTAESSETCYLAACINRSYSQLGKLSAVLLIIVMRYADRNFSTV